MKAVMVVHFGGQAAQMTGETEQQQFGKQKAEIPQRPTNLNTQVSGILEVCRKYGVKVIEDAAHAFPTRLNGRMVGGFGDITCFSFYANKTITTGEGGMLVTNDEAVHHRAKTMRLHGINRDIWDRFTSATASWEYDVVAPGFKYNMPDINAAIGLAQLERAGAMRAERQRCFEYYLKHLGGLDCVDLPVVYGSLDGHSCHLFWLVLKESAPISRNRLIELLGEAGIGTSVHYKPLHRMTYYRERYQLSEKCFPNAERHWRGCVSLPVYPGLSNEELAYVVAAVKRALGERAST
jgi:dTDP-4-amino-4,6-dideoxygalactose transaminase